MIDRLMSSEHGTSYDNVQTIADDNCRVSL